MSCFTGRLVWEKTTLAHVLAVEMNVNIKITAGPAVEPAADLAAILTNLRAGDILFIDESTAWEERLKKCSTRQWKISRSTLSSEKDLQRVHPLETTPCFTVIGATTRLASVSSPLRARFGAVYRLDYYDMPAMQNIVIRVQIF